jgi:hypothetical protein
MKNVELYIENQLVDMDEKVNIVITKQLNDIFDPAKIKNDFTKTVSLPNTSNNNKIFGHIYSPNKIIEYGDTNIGLNFNPSKKSYFKLFVNSELIYKGYVKMLNITYENIYKWRYEITLYGYLGDFFSEFGDLSLKDILQNNSSYNNNYVQYGSIYAIYDGNGYPLLNLWNARKNSNTNRTSLSLNDLYNNDYIIDKNFSGDTRNIYLDLTDAENGLYNDGKKFYSGNANQPSFETAYTEQQVCLKSEPHQRLGFYNDKLIVDLVKELGYTIDNIDGQWINKNNPYWYNTLTTCNTPSVLDDTFSLSGSGTTHTGSAFLTTDFRYLYYIKNLTNITPNDYFSIKSGTTSTISFNGVNGLTNTYTALQVNDNVYPNKFDINYIEYPGSSPRLTVSGLPILVYEKWTPEYDPDVFSHIELNINWMKNDSGTTQQVYQTKRIFLVASNRESNENDAYYFRINHQPPYGIEVRIEETGDWIPLDDLLGYQFTTQMNKYPNTNIQNINMVICIKINRRDDCRVKAWNGVMTQFVKLDSNSFNFANNNFKYSITAVKDVGSLSKVKYLDYLPKIKAVDFFINHLKMFGLYLSINDEEKKIKILTRNEYFSGSTVVDWSTKLDINDEIKITPLNFNTKYITLSYNESDTNSTKVYKSKFNKTYGEQLLNTGYNFNENTYKLFDNNIYSNYVCAAQYYDMYGYNEYPKVIPHFYNDDLSKSKPSDKTFLVFANSGYSTTDISLQKIPYTNTDSGLGATGKTFMYFGFYNLGLYPLFYTEYEVDGYNLNHCILGNNTMGYINLEDRGSSTYPYSCYGPLELSNDYYIETSAYYPSAKNITHSLDFGRPLEQYHNYEYPSGTTIYDRLWKKYLEDRYNVNTKILRAKFYLTDRDLSNFSFNKFIFLFDKYWIINKIEDYNVVDDGLTDVELVSVNDINNYTSGQFL